MGRYIDIDDVRAEGLTEADADDDRVEVCIELAETYVDLVTGQWFDVRELTLNLDGNGLPTLRLPVPLRPGSDALTSATLDDEALDLDDLVIYNRTMPDDRRSPRLVFKDGSDWTEGNQNVELVGEFGYVDASGEDYVAPAPIRRVAVGLVLWAAPALNDEYAQKRRRGFRIVSESTRNRSVTLERLVETGGLTGIREIDTVLAMYRRGMLVGHG